MPTTQPNPLSESELYPKILDAFRQWNDIGANSPLRGLALFRRAQQGSTRTEHQITNKILLDGLKVLDVTKPEHAQVLRLRFLDGIPTYEVANRISVAQSTVDRKQSEAIRALAEILREQEIQALSAHRSVFEARLEAPFYDRLFGVEEHLNTLSGLLREHEKPCLILLEGIGGIGKTTMADALIRHAIDQHMFEDFGWVSARQHRFQLGGTIRALNTPALTDETLIEALTTQFLADTPLPTSFSTQHAFSLLQTRLKQTPHLIVVDNLETIADVEVLLPTLQRLADPTKFLLTSRESIHTEVTAYPFKVPSLTESHALNLVRHEASRLNLPALADGSDEELRPIFETVGGNPLALRLVVAQSRVHALQSVLGSKS